MATMVPPPLQLNRFTTEEVEEIWFDGNSGIDHTFDSTDFTLSNPATPVFHTNTPIIERDDWLTNQGFLKLEPHVVTATPVKTDCNDESTQLCSAAPINFSFPVFDDIEAETSSGSAPSSPLPCDNKQDIALMEAMDKADEEKGIATDEEAPYKRIRLKVSPEIHVQQQNGAKQSTAPAPAPAPKSRSKSIAISVVDADETSAKKANPKPKKETKRRRARNGRNKATKSAVPLTAAQKREERLRRNRESANRSRIRKKQEMGNLRSEVATLRGEVHKLNTQILELEKENDSLRNQLAVFKSPNSAVRPAMAVFALVFTVAFYAQPATDYTALAASHGSHTAPQINTKVWSQDPHHVSVTGFFLAPALDLLPNSMLTSESLDVLPILVDIVTKLFVALVIASISGLVFHFTFKWFQQRKSSHISQRASKSFLRSSTHVSLDQSDRICLLNTV